MSKMSEVTTYLREVYDLFKKNPLPDDLRYRCQAEIVYKEGHAFPANPFTKEEKDILLDIFDVVAHLSPAIKECYRNAFLLATEGEKFGIEYNEGYAMGHILPVEHAWASLNGKPIDVTWRDTTDIGSDAPRLLKRAEKNIEEHAYFGLSIPLSYIRMRMLKTRTYVSAIDDYMGKFPMLKKNFSFSRA